MASKKPFFKISDYQGGLREGAHIEVRRQLIYMGEHADFRPFLKVSPKELDKLLKASMTKEKEVFDQLQTAIEAWEEHGVQTLLLQKAIEYVKTPTVTHTGNEWKQREDGTWEISNLVYQMAFRIAKHGDEWRLTWGLEYTAPGLAKNLYRHPYDGLPKKRIEYEGSKKYKTLEGAQKYIQGKFDQYTAFFSALSPPVPPAVKQLFCVNEQLLPGYTLAKPERTEPDHILVDDLLNYLGDGDLDQPAAVKEEVAVSGQSPAPRKARPASKAVKHSEKKSRQKKAKTGLSR